MPESDPLQILLAHDHWATAQTLTACVALPPDAFYRRFDLGPGSLHDTITHIAGAMRAWTDDLAGRAQRLRLEQDGQHRPPEQLRPLIDEACRELAAEACRLPLADMASRKMKNGQVGAFTRAAIITHVLTHGMHHRAQCLNMLKQLGVTPLPPSSVTEWTWLGEGKG